MTILQRRLYAGIIRMHPPAFRNEFGREMALDSEAASLNTGFASLCLDALQSLARQWAASAMPATTDQAPARKLSLLSGDYIMVSPGGPALANLARASLLSILLLFALAFGVTAPHSRTPIDLPVGSGSQPVGIHSRARNQSNSAGSSSDAASEVFDTRSPGSPSQAHGVHAGNTQGPWLRGRVPQPEGPASIDTALVSYLLHSAIFATFLWLMSVLLYLRPVIARKIALALFALFAFAAPLAYASAQPQQTQLNPELLLFHSATPLSYEVATIKPIDPEAANNMVRLPPGASLSPLSIRRYIMDAYGATYAAQVVGGPDWLTKDSFLIHGKVPDDLEAALQKMTYQDRLERNRAMQQALLADRFHFKAHFETRVLPVYELVPAKGGLKITEVLMPPKRIVDPPARPTSSDPLPPNSSRTTFSSNGLHVLNARAIKMELLARIIGNDAGDRPIVNHTGFTGSFDITGLTWAPLGDAAANNAPDAPSLGVALERTLGIKIAPTKAPIEVLVIDHIEKPSEN